MRFFSTAGPVRPDEHYAVPPLDRLDLRDVLELIRSKQYFVLHAPRQTGKTSALIALRDHLNGGAAGGFRCVSVNVEGGSAAWRTRCATWRGAAPPKATWWCSTGARNRASATPASQR